MEAGGAVIFSRGGGSGPHAKADGSRRSSRGDSGRWDDEHGQLADASDDGFDGALAGGPYDVADAPTGVELLDLGSLRIPAIGGIEIRVQANPDGQIQQVVLVNGESALQLGVFAAPRSQGIW